MQPHKGRCGRDLMLRAKCFVGSKPTVTIRFKPRLLVLFPNIKTPVSAILNLWFCSIIGQYTGL